MPESKGRGKPSPRMPDEQPRKATPTASPRWLAPVMVAFFLIGLLWIVLYYLAPGMPVIGSLGSWNMVVGFGFILVGFALSTRWR